MSASNPPRRSRFFAVFTLLLLLIVFWGFARTLYLKAFFEVPELPGHLYVHGFVLTAWFLLLFCQTWLIQTKRVQIHRRLGIGGSVLAVAVVAVSVWTLVRRDLPAIDEFPNRAAPNLVSLVVFSLCVGSAILLRKRSAAHKRLMLIGSIVITAPALDRMARPEPIHDVLEAVLPSVIFPPEAWFGLLVVLSMFLAIAVHDIATRGRPHGATITGVLSLFVAAPAIVAALTLSGMWSAFVRWVG
jgi:hypothetical protein